MPLVQSRGLAARVEALNAKLTDQLKGNWLHQFEIDSERNIISPESYEYRRRVLDGVFATLLVDKSVLVLDEASGIYPALIHRAGARAVSASNANQRTCDLIREVSAFLDVPTTTVTSKMVAFYEDEPYVDMEFERSHDFLLVLGQIWPMFGASGKSFDAIVEACAFFVTDGLVFDWTDAAWASPPPPPDYSLSDFCDALRRKFEFVAAYNDWLVVAVGKLPPAGGDGERAVREQSDRRPARRGRGRATSSADAQSYADDFVPRFRETVCRATPGDATVIVVSKGDPELLALEGRNATHFPQAESGEYAGYHPRDSAAAIDQLEALRSRGSQFLVLPKPVFWWLEHYGDFRDHLEREYERVLDDEDTCIIFSLTRDDQPTGESKPKDGRR